MKRMTYGLRRASLGKRHDLGLSEVAHGDDIDLDGGDAGVALELLQAGQDLVQAVPPRNLVEAIVLQRVQADVDALQARFGEWPSHGPQQEPVGRQTQTAHGQARDAGHKLGQVGPQRRLTTRSGVARRRPG